jgi:hypothetical protein
MRPIAESDHTESIEAASGEFLTITAVGDTVSYEPEVMQRFASPGSGTTRSACRKAPNRGEIPGVDHVQNPRISVLIAC